MNKKTHKNQHIMGKAQSHIAVNKERKFPVGEYAVMGGGAAYHTRECICIWALPPGAKLYVTKEVPIDVPHCKECQNHRLAADDGHVNH
jgi:hypothetical protein